MTTNALSFELDGERVQAEPGQTILCAADAAGIYIPRLCHLEGLEPFGGCRMCTVLVNGRPTAACTQPAVADAVVLADTPELNRERRMLLELLFVEGNHFCMSCEKSGACELQALAYRLGLEAAHFPFLEPTRELDASHPDVFLDRDRCILCARCVRASRDLDAKQVLGFLARGESRHVGVGGGRRLADTDLAESDAAMRVCPVGALLPKRAGFQVPVGRRPFDTEPIGHEVEEARG